MGAPDTDVYRRHWSLPVSVGSAMMASAMTDLEALRESIVEDMDRLEDRDSIRDSFSIAQHYALSGYGLPLEDIQDIVREVAGELGFTGIC